jgi:hypothetical protein
MGMQDGREFDLTWGMGNIPHEVMQMAAMISGFRRYMGNCNTGGKNPNKIFSVDLK